MLLLPFLINARVTALYKRHLFEDGSSEGMECKSSCVKSFTEAFGKKTKDIAVACGVASAVLAS